MMNTTSNAVDAEWYREKRRAVEAFFAQPNLMANDETDYRSPSGRYRLVVREYDREPGWNYAWGRVYSEDRLLADVKRNYSIFYHGWAEAHPNGHDYLLCGEDYQGQTVIELDTGRRADYIPLQAESGWGFCCAAYWPSPDRKLIAIDGCYWGCSYELVVCRFDDTLALPWPQIERIAVNGAGMAWIDEGFCYEMSEDIRISDGKAFDDLTDDEREDFWKRLKEIGGKRKRRYLWLANGENRLLDVRVERS